MSTVQTERVLVVPTEILHDLGYFQGFCGDVARYLDELLSPENTSYRPRSDMENDPNFKQLIPYVIFQHTEPGGARKIFQYRRGKGQGEGRLHSKRSVGVGGHISSDDAESNTDLHPYEEGMQRELNEEVRVDAGFTTRCVGLINDDLTEVGKVHLGIVHIVDVDRPAVHPVEADILEAQFLGTDQIRAELEEFETWSQICIKALGSDTTSA